MLGQYLGLRMSHSGWDDVVAGVADDVATQHSVTQCGEEESTVGWVESGHSHPHHHCSRVISVKTSSSSYHRKYVDQVWWRIWCRPRLKLKIRVLEIFGSEIPVRTAFAYNQYLMNIQYHLNSTW